jgi:hypothetical protein
MHHFTKRSISKQANMKNLFYIFHIGVSGGSGDDDLDVARAELAGNGSS